MCNFRSTKFKSVRHKVSSSKTPFKIHLSLVIVVVLHNEELNDLYSSPNIVRVIKSRRMRWVGHVARMGEERGHIGSWWGNRRERDHWGDLGVDGWIILGWISRRWDVGMWTGLGWPRIGTGDGRL